MNEYKAFIQKLHSGFNTPEEILYSVVNKATGDEIKSRGKILRGESNEVYDILTTKGRNLILRVSRKGDDRLLTERWAVEKSKLAGVPVPDILLVEKFATEEGPLEISLETKLSGTPLDILLDKEYDNKWLEMVLYQAGELLSTINEIKTDGFGELDKNGTSPYKNSEDYFMHAEKDRNEFLKAADKSNIPRFLIENVFRIIRENVALYKNLDSVLIHNDYSPKHLLIDGYKITGVLDFETVRGGDPIQDLARWEYYWGDRCPTTMLNVGYSNKSIFDENFERKLHLYMLYKGLILLWYETNIGNKSGLRHTKKQIMNNLKYFGVSI